MKGTDRVAVVAAVEGHRLPALRDAVDGMEGLDVDLREAASFEALGEALQRSAADVFVVDVGFDGKWGSAVLALADVYDCQAPLVFVQPRADADQAVRLLRGGAADAVAWDGLDARALAWILRQALARHEALASRQHTGGTFRALIENAQDLITVLDGSGSIRYESPSIERMLGYAPDEMIGRYAFDFIHPDDLPDILELFLFGIQNPGYTATAEFRFRHKDGSWRTLQSCAKNLLDDPVVQGVVINSRDLTERREAEEALRQSEGKFRDLFENSPDAVFVEDLAGTVLDVNPAACRLHGYAREDLVGKTIVDLVPPNQGRAVQRMFERMVAGEVEYLEGFSWTSDGRSVPVELRARRVTYGREPALLLHVRDITERRAAEEALRQSEAHNRALLDALPDAMVRLSREGTYLEVRVPKGYEAFADPERLVGVSAYDALPPEVGARLMRGVEDALATGELQSFDYAIQVGGERRYREARVVAYGLDQVISIQRDITERKQAEEEVRRLKAFYEQVLNDIPADVSVVDPEARIIYLNRRSVSDPEMREWLIGKTAYDYCRRRNLDVEIARRREAAVAQAVAERRLVQFEEALHRDTGVRYILRIASPVVEADGSIRQVIGYGLDITDRKLAENEIRRSGEQLRELAQHLQSVREEERRRISREVHDVLGQSLTALRMDLAWIERGVAEPPPPLAARFEAMKERIAETIRTVRRIASELRPGILDDLGLNAALEWQAQDFAAHTGVGVDFVDETDALVLDPERSTALFRIFQEILTNVARHAGASHVEVLLRAEDATLVLEVRDDGRGIREAELADTTSLGLLGMRERAQAWGGTVHLAGAAGQGTRVTVRVPLP